MADPTNDNTPITNPPMTEADHEALFKGLSKVEMSVLIYISELALDQQPTLARAMQASGGTAEAVMQAIDRLKAIGLVETVG